MSGRQSSWTLPSRRVAASLATSAADSPAVPRIAKLMALAIKLDQQVREGVFRDYAEIARLGYVTRARLTQIMNLLNLAADIQEKLLAGEVQVELRERHLRPIAAEVVWSRQRALFARYAQTKSD
jgi:hypothetical protein